jgi:FMN-dependent NADH-azoreductase
MKKILFINCAVRPQSRTAELSRCVLSYLDGDITEIRPHEMGLPIPDDAFLSKRDRLSECGFDDPLAEPAKQFAEADEIVVCAPYWDLSFPAALKQYFEQINIIGLTFAYDESGTPYGMCRAKKLYYVSTSGGKMVSEEYGLGYVRALCETFYGIKEVVSFRAEMLDIVGIDAQAELAKARTAVQDYFQRNKQE